MRSAKWLVVPAVSNDGQWLATGDLLNRIHVFNFDTQTVRGVSAACVLLQQ